jgi:hypothetical protein
MTSAIHSHLNRQAARAREQGQAVPRPARVRFAVKTSGVGESRLVGKSAISFGAYMLDEPTFSYGVVALDPIKVGELPLCTATVLNWQRTAAGLFAGAELGFKVESMLYTVRLKFTLTFEGSTLRTTNGQGTGTLSAQNNNRYTGATSYSTDDL